MRQEDAGGVPGTEMRACQEYRGREANGPRCGGRQGLRPAQVSCPDGEEPAIQHAPLQAGTFSLGKDSGFCSVKGGPESVFSKGVSLFDRIFRKQGWGCMDYREAHVVSASESLFPWTQHL